MQILFLSPLSDQHISEGNEHTSDGVQILYSIHNGGNEPAHDILQPSSFPDNISDGR